MATALLLFCENKRRFFSCAARIPLSIEGHRRVLATRYRYCIGEQSFYAPAEQDGLEDRDRLYWVRCRDYVGNLDDLSESYNRGKLNEVDIRVGNTYTKRRKEADGKFEKVEAFVSKEFYQNLQKNPEALPSVSKSDFEALCAEIFSRKGFEVDLFRDTKDGGIDFLAVKGDEIDPLIFAVQCKQPDQRVGKSRKSLGRPVVQQIYGAAKAWDLAGAVAISGSTYSDDAAKFAMNKPEEIKLYNAQNIIEWLSNYRWNDDE